MRHYLMITEINALAEWEAKQWLNERLSLFRHHCIVRVNK